MSQMLYPLFGAYSSDSLFALLVPGPAGVYEGLDPSISGAGGSAGWTVTLAPGAWKTAGDPAGTSLSNAKGRFLIREDASFSFPIAAPSSQDRIDLVVGIYLYAMGPADTSVTPPAPTGAYTTDQMATYGVIQGLPASIPIPPAVPDPFNVDGHRAVILAQVYVSAAGIATPSFYWPNDLRAETFASSRDEVFAAREGAASLKARIDGIALTPGAAATISLGTVTTGAPGSEAVITVTGTAQDAVLNITLPQGGQGPAGLPGTNGTPGAAATISIGTITTGAPGSEAAVSNTGTASAAMLAITIPQGAQGTVGPPGADAVLPPTQALQFTAAFTAPGTGGEGEPAINGCTISNVLDVGTYLSFNAAQTPTYPSDGSGSIFYTCNETGYYLINGVITQLTAGTNYPVTAPPHVPVTSTVSIVYLGS